MANQPVTTYRRRLTLLGRLLRTLIRRRTANFPPSKKITSTQVGQIVDALWPAFVDTRATMQIAALDLHETVSGFRPEVYPIVYRKAWLNDIVTKNFQKPWNQAIDAGLKAEPKKVTEKLIAAVQGQAERAAQRTTLHAIEQDVLSDETKTSNDKVIGHARMVQGEYTCAWCVMLASRGPVYSKDEYDQWQKDHDAYMWEFHWKCDCILVPVLKSQEKSWPGYKDFKLFEAAWGRITKGYSGVAAVNRWRQHFREAERRNLNPLTMPLYTKEQRNAA